MRGLRNNNPLNIRHSADRWQGARVEQTDKAFVQFTSMAYGYRAAWKVLDSYWKHFRQKKLAYNVRNIISRWAPPAENDTEAYIRHVVKLSGLGTNENQVRPSNGRYLERMALLIRAMTCVENGIKMEQVDMEALWQGYDLAWPGRRWNGADIDRSEPLLLTPFKAPDPHQNSTLQWDEYWDWCAPSLTDAPSDKD